MPSFSNSSESVEKLIFPRSRANLVKNGNSNGVFKYQGRAQGNYSNDYKNGVFNKRNNFNYLRADVSNSSNSTLKNREKGSGNREFGKSNWGIGTKYEHQRAQNNVFDEGNYSANYNGEANTGNGSISGPNYIFDEIDSVYGNKSDIGTTHRATNNDSGVSSAYNSFEYGKELSVDKDLKTLGFDLLQKLSRVRTTGARKRLTDFSETLTIDNVKKMCNNANQYNENELLTIYTPIENNNHNAPSIQINLDFKGFQEELQKSNMAGLFNRFDEPSSTGSSQDSSSYFSSDEGSWNMQGTSSKDYNDYNFKSSSMQKSKNYQVAYKKKKKDNECGPVWDNVVKTQPLFRKSIDPYSNSARRKY